MAEPKPLTAETIAPRLSKVSRTADGRGFALIHLDCSAQDATDVAELAAYQHLRHVNLKANQLTDLKALSGLQYIIHLDVSANQVRNLDCFSEAVLPHCRTLDASKNQLESIGMLQIGRLRTANFRGNKITSVDYFPGHELLEELDLGENELANCAGVANMPSLVTLSLDQNKLTTIEGLAGLPKVAVLSLAGQKDEAKLEALDVGALKGCEGVERLDVSENGLPAEAFWNLQALPKLRHLKAEGNPVEGNFKIEVLTSLARLDTVNDEEVTPEDREAAVTLAEEKKAAAEAAAAEAAAAEAAGGEAEAA